jgi:predicted dehydrogenase
VASVAADGMRTWSERTTATGPRAGERFPVHVDTHVTLLLRFASGVLGTLLTSFDVQASDLPRIEVFGELGTLSLPDPNTFKGPVRRRASRTEDWQELPTVAGFAHDARGIGAIEMVLAERQGRTPRASGALASHVLDVLEGGLTAIQSGQRVSIDSRPERPAPLSPAELESLGWAPEVHA